MSKRLAGKRIVITGAAQGIGLAMAEEFLKEGASLFLIDRDGLLLDQETARLKAAGGTVASTTADITDADAIAEAIRQAEQAIGRPNAL
eukprot:gene50067-61275_t